MNPTTNPVMFFEIPATDLERAKTFYKAVFNVSFEDASIDGNDMSFFSFDSELKGISGALAKGETYKPTKEGVIIYFHSKNIDETLEKVLEQNGTIFYPKTSVGSMGFVAEFIDTEGNRIAIHQDI
jgi:predicted enzyme related to lactoylglutathione lyase